MGARSGVNEAHESPPSARIECHQDLSAFFHETLSRALLSRRIEASTPTEHYLVGLLAVLAHDTAPLSRSLVELELDASQASQVGRAERLRTLGDQALSVSGLFDAHLERCGISRVYVTEVGSRAYLNASHLVSQSRWDNERVQAEVFFDLGARFATYAEVLDDVREATALGTPDDVLALYERYQKTHSPALLERLSAHGVYALSEAPPSGAPSS